MTMPATVTLTLSPAALTTAVDAVLEHTFRFEFTNCRNLTTLVAECGGACQDDLDFLKAARDAGVNISKRAKAVRKRLPGG